MSLIKVFKVRDGITPTLADLRKELGGLGIHQVLGQALLDEVQRHLESRNEDSPNKLGGRRKNFWSTMAEGSTMTAATDYAEVQMPRPMRQKFYGGTIRPLPPKKGLVFPIAAESYGMTYGEYKDSHGGKVPKGLFAFVRYVTQAADPRALPTDDALATAAFGAVENNLLAAGLIA